MTSLLIRFGCDQAALGALETGGRLAAGVAVFEPLVLWAEARLAEDGLHLAVGVALPDLAPWGALQIAGEAGVLDCRDRVWHASVLAAALRPPTAALPRVRLGARPDVLRYASPSGRVSFGLLVGELTLVPGPGSDARPLPKAYTHPGFVTRRLRAENRRLRAQVRDLEANLDSVLTAACPASPASPAAASPASPASPAAASPASPAAASPASPAAASPASSSTSIAGSAASDPAGATPAAAAPGAAAAPAEAESCAVCFDAPADALFRPCGHACCCGACAAALPRRLCPLCRAPIESTGRAARPGAHSAGAARLSNRA